MYCAPLHYPNHPIPACRHTEQAAMAPDTRLEVQVPRTPPQESQLIHVDNSTNTIISPGGGDEPNNTSNHDLQQPHSEREEKKAEEQEAGDEHTKSTGDEDKDAHDDM